MIRQIDLMAFFIIVGHDESITRSCHALQFLADDHHFQAKPVPAHFDDFASHMQDIRVFYRGFISATRFRQNRPDLRQRPVCCKSVFIEKSDSAVFKMSKEENIVEVPESIHFAPHNGFADNDMT